MSRLLLIITRMYAPKGQNNDEFTQFWVPMERKNENHISFRAIGEDGQALYVLVMHGHDYPDDPDQRMFERLLQSVTDGLDSLGLPPPPSDRKTGILFHPNPVWRRVVYQKILEALKERPLADVPVNFFERYGGESKLVTSLAIKCRGGQKFTDEFNRIWDFFHSQVQKAKDSKAKVVDLTDHAQDLGFLKHAIVNLLQPIDINLQTWAESNYDVDCGLEIAEEYADKRAQTHLAQAKLRILGDENSPGELQKITAAVIAKNAGTAKEKAISQLTAEIKGLFASDDYQRAEKLLATLGSAPARTKTEDVRNDDKQNQATGSIVVPAERVLEKLRDELRAGNPFHEWYKTLSKKLDDLRNLLSE